MLVIFLVIRYSRTQNFHDEVSVKTIRFCVTVHGQKTLYKAARWKIFLQKHKIGQGNHYFPRYETTTVFFPNKIQNNVHFIQTSENKHYSDSLWAFSRTILHLCFTPFVENAVHKTLLCKQTTPYPSENCIPGTMALMWSDRAPGKTATSSNNRWKHPWNGRKLNKFSESTSPIKNWSTLLAVSITRWSLESKSEV